MAAQKPPTLDDEKPAEKTYELTESQLQQMMERTAEAAATRALESIPGAPSRKRLRNSDFASMVSKPKGQTQSDVALVAQMVGPVTHQPGFIANPPESISDMDWEENRPLITQIEGMGYTVILRGVEFDAFWNPQKKVVEDGRAAWRPEIDASGNFLRQPPQEAALLLAKLRDAEAIHSTVWIQRWTAGRPVTGDRQIDTLVANARSPEAEKVGNVLANAEARNFAGHDNTGLPI